ncbi:MAG TPA: hypothetical protein VEI74_14305 [Candidatus Methylomirabilis sp.]|nr:hypothetical protein [Candidatus Methylomirabilis sp.]
MSEAAPMRRPEQRWRLIAAVLLWLSTTAWAGGGVAAESTWIEHAEGLVAAAKGHADVAQFRQDVETQRERLREIVRQEGPQPTPERRQLHVSMILLNALLKSASDCHQGGRVVCPAQLLRQLDEQVNVVQGQLRAVQG